MTAQLATTKSKPTPPKLSVLVPIYNAADYLAKCLTSLLDQTLTDLEIICINDGSTDDSLKIIKQFQRTDPRITLIDKSNSGYGDSMNRALARAHGDYIGILEPDDWIEPDAFARLYSVAKAYHADVVKANYYRTSYQNRQKTPQDHLVSEIKPLPSDHSDSSLAAPAAQSLKPSDPKPAAVLGYGVHPELFRLAPAIWSAIYKRDFLCTQKVNFLPTPGASYQDLSFSFKVWTLSRKTVLLPEAFVHYRIDNSNSSINNPGKVNCVVDEYAEIETFLCERGLFSQFGTTMTAAKFRNYHWNFQRLRPPLAKEFFQTWRQEFLAAREDQLLDRSLYSRKDWSALQAILKHPHFAYHLLRFRIFVKRIISPI